MPLPNKYEEVKLFLEEYPETLFTIREIARKLKLTYNEVWITMLRLENEGLLYSEQVNLQTRRFKYVIQKT